MWLDVFGWKKSECCYGINWCKDDCCYDNSVQRLRVKCVFQVLVFGCDCFCVVYEVDLFEIGFIVQKGSYIKV